MSRRVLALCAFVSCSVLAPLFHAALAAPVVLDRQQNVLSTVEANGTKTMLPPRPAFSSPVWTPDGWPEPAGREVGPGQPCPLSIAPPEPGFYQRQSRQPGWIVDACGRVVPDPDFTGPLPGVANRLAGSNLAVSVKVTIDSMTTGEYYGDSYSPWSGIDLLGGARTYYLSDHATWSSGAGSYTLKKVLLARTEVDGTKVRYILIPPADSVIYQQTDYDSGDHSAQGTLKAAGPLVLEATIGSTSAILRGVARVASNEATWYGEPAFNYYTALAGSVVPFTIRYTLSSGAWAANTLDGSFSYTMSGFVDFVHAVSSPTLLALDISGPAQVPDRSTAQYAAAARYQGGVLRDVTGNATWSVTPAALASVSQGQLITKQLQASHADLTLEASYTFGDVTLQASKTVVCRADLFLPDSTAWPMYQANERHTGYLPLTLRPQDFKQAWSTALGSGQTLNPVTAADGRVFASLVTYFSGGENFFALDARDGHVMWSKGFTGFSVNPPSCAYGNVYLQTCNHSSDTWLHAFDAATGNQVFKSPHSAQWERYFSPTIFNGRAYVDGGSYGGMYAFDALSGGQLWYLGLPQYDQWTPAVDSNYVYAYVGSYSPGLYVARRSDAAQAFMIPDPDFDWNGWSMNLAPVLGGHNDVLATHDGRLIRFDLATRRIAWQLARSFSGQPSVARDAIYAIDGGSLAVLDQVTGASRWSWKPGRGSLSGSLIVTDSHVFACSQDSVFAIDLTTRARAWAYGVAGPLALANGQLYVAGGTGVLTAITVRSAAPSIRASAGRDTTVECASPDGRGTPVRLDGRGSVGQGLTYLWTAPGVTFDDPHSPTPTGLFPWGATSVELQVSLGAVVTRDTVLVTVRDTRPPRLVVTLSPSVLWPPNHQPVPIHATVSIVDSCDASPGVVLFTVMNSEAAGTTDADAVQEADYGTADFDFLLRAERDGNGPGRVYTVCYQGRDAAGNRVLTCQDVLVPHDQSGRARLEPESGAWTLTLYGSATHDVRSIAGSSILVRSGNSDLFRAAGVATAFRDVDGDGSDDATFSLVAAGDGATAARDGGLWVRWRAAGHDYLASLAGSSVAGVDGAPVAFAARVGANPSVSRALLHYALPAAGHVRLQVFDVAGRLVATLVDSDAAAGEYVAAFDGRTGAGAQIYLYRLDWQGRRLGGKFVLLE